jgi:hypothetical protein
MTSRLVLLFGAAAMLSGSAQAQTTGVPAPTTTRGYVEFVAHSSFGNAPSQSYGGEVGWTIAPQLQLFGLAGRTSNVAPPAFGAGALVIAQYLQRTQSGTVSFTAEQPITFGAGGVKYLIPTSARVAPYVLAGAGMANVSSDARFLVGGTDITGNLAAYGVTLGTDLSGSVSKPMLTFGGGVLWPFWKNVGLDFQYRLGRVMNGTSSITTQLAGAGLAARF